MEKGDATSGVLETLTELFPDHPLVARSEQPVDPDAQSEGALAFDGDMVVHELRTPLTVITGMLATLRDRMDVLPSATTHELIEAAGRNARHMAQLLDAVSDARRASHGILPVTPEPTDLGALVRASIADLCVGHNAQRGGVGQVDRGAAARMFGEELADLPPHVVRAAIRQGQVLAAVAALDDDYKLHFRCARHTEALRRRGKISVVPALPAGCESSVASPTVRSHRHNAVSRGLQDTNRLQRDGSGTTGCLAVLVLYGLTQRSRAAVGVGDG